MPLRRLAPLLMIGVLLLASAPAHAAPGILDPKALNDLVDAFKQVAGAWEGALRNIAIDLFAILAGIEVVWVVGRVVARRGDFGDILEAIAIQIVSIGIFFTLMINFATSAQAIIDTF